MSKPRRILFVCTGNTCRSPIAEALARHRLAQAGASAEVRSAGVSASVGVPASSEAVRAMDEMGIDLSAHRSGPVTADLLEWADEMYAMTAGHLSALGRLVPERAARMTLLDPDGRDVDDPFGGPLDTYRATAEQIDRMLRARLEELHA